jgi:hypothetical protein
MHIGNLVELLEKNGYTLKVYYDRVDVVAIDNQVSSWRIQKSNLVSIVCFSLIDDNCIVIVNYFDQKNQSEEKRVRHFPVDNLESQISKITDFIKGND